VDWLAAALLRWFDQHGRKDLPWQRDPSPYRVWISEIMLQQTQVATVIPYFDRFMQWFPDVSALARAAQDDVLHSWTGLGYYARARNLHLAAQRIDVQHGGALPQTLDGLMALPGIGRSTAGAILSIAHRRRAPILDGNVKRVLARVHAVPGHAGQSAWLKALWAFAERHTPHQRLPDYTQAIMDLGALICTRKYPHCTTCPLNDRCDAHRQGIADRLPEPRPRRALPVRRVRMFLLEDAAGRFLLERRPPAGLWGGLWGPPERAAEHDARTLIGELRLETAGACAVAIGTGFRHTFTHFHMDIEPVHVRIAHATAAIAETKRLRWYDPAGDQRIGLSAAAVKLLAAATAGGTVTWKATESS
jgi:A/G-specific adenine glycosylase